MSSRKLEDLYPQTRAKVSAWLAECKRQGLDILVTSTFRSFKEQDALYAQGRTKPGKRVTNARGGQSTHNVRRGIDFVPLTNGKPDWSAKNPDLLSAATIGNHHELAWGGNWRTFKDMLHLQDQYCKTCDKDVGSSASHFNEDGSCRLTKD